MLIKKKKNRNFVYVNVNVDLTAERFMSLICPSINRFLLYDHIGI